MKKIYVVILVAILLILLGSIILIKPKNKEKEEEPEVIYSFKPNYPDNYMGNLYNKLYQYSFKLYDNKDYLKYKKVEDFYFISLEDLKNDYQYDVSIYKGEDGTPCNLKDSGLYFDPDNKLDRVYDENNRPVIPDLIGCGDLPLE